MPCDALSHFEVNFEVCAALRSWRMMSQRICLCQTLGVPPLEIMTLSNQLDVDALMQHKGGNMLHHVT